MGIKPDSISINKKSHYELAGYDLVDIASKYETPLYIIDKETISKNCRKYTETLLTSYPDFEVIYAAKACINKGIIKFLGKNGCGVDVVSGGELMTAIQAGIDSKKIIFHGNNKSVDELKLALKNNIRIIVDNHQELSNIIQLSDQLGIKAQVLIRVKPEIQVKTHKYIMTGHSSSKFGVSSTEMIDLMNIIKSNSNINCLGIHCHIGSQILDHKPYLKLINFCVNQMKLIKEEVGLEVDQLNIGGGIGISYTDSESEPDIPMFLEAITKKLKEECRQNKLKLPKLMVEPGRSIVGNAGVTLYKVGTLKKIPNQKNYVFIDGGMADNPRPSMYQSKYTIKLANKAELKEEECYSIAGKFCESGDILAESVQLPKVMINDLLIVFGTGAYNYSMSSNYNRFCKPAMVALDQQGEEVWVKRETYDDLLQHDM